MITIFMDLFYNGNRFLGFLILAIQLTIYYLISSGVIVAFSWHYWKGCNISGIFFSLEFWWSNFTQCDQIRAWLFTSLSLYYLCICAWLLGSIVGIIWVLIYLYSYWSDSMKIHSYTYINAYPLVVCGYKFRMHLMCFFSWLRMLYVCI